MIQRRLNVIVLSLSLASATAFAQPRQKDAFIVIPASTSDAMEMQRVMQAAEQSVMQLANSFPVRDAWPLEQTRRRFRQTQSREPAAVSPSELEKLPRQVREALDNYAFGQHALALHQVQGLMERVDRAQETLMRDPQVARQFLDACLIRVRAALDRHDDDDALESAEACRALALDVGPTTYLHPGPVLETFKAADEELRRRLAGRLTVTSEPAHCTVLLNGRALGLTPYEVRPPIGPQRVQVECPGDQEPGRVHSVPVAQGDVTLRVWVGFESALRSEPGKPLRLQLDSQQALAQHALEYAHEIGRVLGVEHVLLVRSFEPDSVVFERADAPEKHLQAEVSYDAARGTGSDLRPALRALAEGRSWRRDPNLPLDCGDRARAMVEAGQRVEAQAFVLRCLQAGRPDVDGTQQPPQVTELYDAAWQQLAHEAAYDGSAQSASGQDIKLSTVPPPSPRGAMQSRREEDEGPRAAGALPVLGTIVGAAGMVSAAVLFDASDTRSGRSAAIGLEAVSSAVLLPSFAIWTFPRTRDGIPWWSWTAGAAGLAGLAWGIRDLAVNDVCKRPERGCAPGHYGADLDGGMLFAASAPFVLLPLAHALWNHDGPQSSEVAVTPTGRGLTITGRF